jgi:hypothetical protein
VFPIAAIGVPTVRHEHGFGAVEFFSNPIAKDFDSGHECEVAEYAAWKISNEEISWH